MQIPLSKLDPSLSRAMRLVHCKFVAHDFYICSITSQNYISDNDQPEDQSEPMQSRISSQDSFSSSQAHNHIYHVLIHELF